jgi:hypothetical protein
MIGVEKGWLLNLQLGDSGFFLSWLARQLLRSRYD